MLYGSLNGTVHMGPEPHLLPAFRFQTEGMNKFIACSASDAKEIVSKHRGKTEATWDDYKNLFRDLKEADVTTFKELGVKLFHGTLVKGMVLYLPAGFVLATASCSQCTKHQAALKVVCMPKALSEWMADQMSAVGFFQPSGTDLKSMQTISDTCAIRSE